MASRIFAWSASARVCAAVMSHSDTVSGTGELNATSKGWNSGVYASQALTTYLCKLL